VSVKHRLAPLAFAGLLAFALAACGSSASPPAPQPVAEADATMTHPKIVQNPSGNPDAWYEPNPIRVKVGQAITWTNKDGDPHDVTADNGAFASGPIGAGGTYRMVLTAPGKYTFFCTLHPEMHGEIIVTR
jgi:plastocyanin